MTQTITATLIKARYVESKRSWTANLTVTIDGTEHAAVYVMPAYRMRGIQIYLDGTLLPYPDDMASPERRISVAIGEAWNEYAIAQYDKRQGDAA